MCEASEDADAATQTWTSGDCTCTLDDNGVFTVSGAGAMANYSLSSARPWHQSAQNIVSVVFEDGVTAIGNYTFTECYSITSVTMASVETVGQYAFKGCTSLASINYNDGLLSIGHYSCQNCTALQRITIPASVTNIYAGAFQGCTALNDIRFMADTWVATLASASFSLGTADTPAAAVVSSPYNVADGKLDSVKGGYTTLTYARLYLLITANVNDPAYGTVDLAFLSVDYGSSISAAANVLTVGTTDIVATPAAATAQYTYAFDSWSGVPASGTVTEDITATANFTRAVNQYTVTIAPNQVGWGTVDV